MIPVSKRVKRLPGNEKYLTEEAFPQRFKLLMLLSVQLRMSLNVCEMKIINISLTSVTVFCAGGSLKQRGTTDWTSNTSSQMCAQVKTI